MVAGRRTHERVVDGATRVPSRARCPRRGPVDRSHRGGRSRAMQAGTHEADRRRMATDYRRYVNRDLPLVERACLSKARFVSRGEARQAVRSSRVMTGVAAYHCRWCDHWHIGHRRRAGGAA